MLHWSPFGTGQACYFDWPKCAAFMSSYKNINNKRITNQSPMLSKGDSTHTYPRLVSAQAGFV